MILVAGLDLETTGLDPEDHRIIEIAICVYDLRTGNKVGSFEKRVHPQRTIQPKAQEVHGISIEDLKGCPIWSEIAPKVNSILSKCHVVVGHNGIGFDFPFLAIEQMKAGLELPDNLKAVDTMTEARWATSDGKVPSLKELAFSLGFEYDESKAHAALYDVELMMDCFFKAREKYGYFQIDDIDGVSEAA